MTTPFAQRALPWMLVATFLAAAALLFTSLGHYALWEDEAGSALGAESVLQSGDTRAWVGHNLIAYRHGFVLHNLRAEGEPPFNAYFAAPFLKMLGANAWGARFPFALCGLATVGILLWWVWKAKAAPLTAAVFCLALLGNVSFFLYARQCHYYGPALFFFTAIAYLYLHWEGSRRKLALMSLCLALLMAANYSFYVLLCLCLAADYAIWQRKARALRLADWAVLLGPSLVMGLVILTWWNPFRTGLGDRVGLDSLSQRVTLFFWHWRDMNQSEMIV
ncbi:MAG: glycosyltransferase family 39 protein, partial [Chthoniobacteraceae bacterium]|nr:glycosyltransferase family 39 protein [Chthoniobacteraceae bacterium]